MNEDDLRELLPAERPLPALRRHDMRERLAERIEAEGRASRRSYRVGMAAVAAALVVVAGAVALLADRGDDGQRTVTTPAARTLPDAAEAERAIEHFGSRPMLQAEVFACTGNGSSPEATPEGDGGDTTAILWDIELTAPMTRDAMIDACFGSYFYASGAVGPVRTVQDEARLCAEVGRGGYVAPKVAFDGLTCAQVDARPLSDDDLAELDRRRAVEVALLADTRECPTVEETVEWVEDVLAEERLDLEVRVDDEPILEPGMEGEGMVPVEPPPCPRFARVDWDAGVVWVEPFQA